MRIRIDYLNRLREPRHTFLDGNTDVVDLIGFEILNIIKEGATDIRIYKI